MSLLKIAITVISALVVNARTDCNDEAYECYKWAEDGKCKGQSEESWKGMTV
jgi:hypothetical protein